MGQSLFSTHFKNLPKYLFLLVLLAYPLFAYVVSKTMGEGMTVFKAFGLICLGYIILRIYEIYKTRSTLAIPFYVVFFGLFTGYTLLCYMFKSNHFAERGIKYFYSDSIWLTFISLIIVENTRFSNDSLRFVKKILWLTLILASIVSVVQISNPLFFSNDEWFVKGLSTERMADYLENSKIDLPSGQGGYVARFLDGYRMSIFSYINGISVGIDTIAIFSILVAWKPTNFKNKAIASISTAIISFLSSGRWVMLNFLVVGSQDIWNSKNRLLNAFKYGLYFIILLMLLILLMNFMGIDIQRFVKERLMSEDALTRVLAFEVFFEVFPDNPIFGTGGVDTEKMVRLLGGRSSQIHVGFLKLFYYYGLIGGLLYLSFMVAFLVRLRKMARYSGYWGGFYAILAFFIANLTLFELSLFYYGPLLAIIVANHFYANKMEEKATAIMNGKSDHPTLN